MIEESATSVGKKTVSVTRTAGDQGCEARFRAEARDPVPRANSFWEAPYRREPLESVRLLVAR